MLLSIIILFGLVNTRTSKTDHLSIRSNLLLAPCFFREFGIIYFFYISFFLFFAKIHNIIVKTKNKCLKWHLFFLHCFSPTSESHVSIQVGILFKWSEIIIFGYLVSTISALVYCSINLLFPMYKFMGKCS